MKYMLLIYGEEAAEAAMSPERTGEVLGAYRTFTEGLVAAGALVSADRLQPVRNATTVRDSAFTTVRSRRPRSSWAATT